jgi:hypothetical protein
MPQRFYQKATVQAAIATAVGAIIIAVICVVFNRGGQSVSVDVEDSPAAKTQTAVNSPGATQIIADKVSIEVSAKLERKLTLDAVYVNKPENDKYVTLLRGRLKIPYPIPNLRIQAHGNTVEEIKVAGTGIYVLSDRGKNEGYAFATWQDATGHVELIIVSQQPEKLHISFTVQE